MKQAVRVSERPAIKSTHLLGRAKTFITRVIPPSRIRRKEVVIFRASQTEIRRLELAILNSTPHSNQRPCPLCGELERRLVFQRDRWDVVECSACNMVFIGDKPLGYGTQAAEHDRVDDYEEEVSRRKKDRPMLMFFSRPTRPFRTDATRRQFSHTIRWKREGKLLDLGCGDGRFLAMAARQFDVTGVELSARAAQAAKGRVPQAPILVSPVTDAAVPADSFDIVTQFGYLEHEWQPRVGLQAAFYALKSGGVLVIKTPNYASWNRIFMGETWCGIHIPSHCNYFTPSTLDRALREAGFSPQPRPLLDRLPTSDTLWMAAQKPQPQSGVWSGAIFRTLVCYSRDARSGGRVFRVGARGRRSALPVWICFTVMVYRISSFRARFVPAR
jgi:2-polyprenyl-3-methyl-5-hydroxy-6-metoxy-1,4-benzoquinol methylase